MRVPNDSGAWPSGKAAGFGPAIRRFESFRPRNSIEQIDYNICTLFQPLSQVMSSCPFTKFSILW